MSDKIKELDSQELESIQGGRKNLKMPNRDSLVESVKRSASACGVQSAALQRSIAQEAKVIAEKEGRNKNTAKRAMATPGCKRCW